MRTSRPKLALALLVAALAVAVLASRPAHASQTTRERIQTLETQIAQRQAAVRSLEERKAELTSIIASSPNAAGANFERRRELRQADQFIGGYRRELKELTRQLALARAQLEGDKPGASRPGAKGAGKPSGRAAPRSTSTPPPDTMPSPAAEPDAHELAGAGDPDAERLDAGEVRDFMWNWAMGREGAPAEAGSGDGRVSALAVAMSGLDWSLDWQALSLGMGLGAVLGSALCFGSSFALKRFFPSRAPLVGAQSRKWSAAALPLGSPSRQWVQLSERAKMPVRVAGAALGLVALLAMAQALASITGWGMGLDTPPPWGELVLLAVAIALGASAAVMVRRRSLTAGLAGLVALVDAAILVSARAASPFGGSGSIEWIVLLVLACGALVPGIGYLWQLASVQQARAAVQRVLPAAAALGALVGLSCAALRLLSV